MFRLTSSQICGDSDRATNHSQKATCSLRTICVELECDTCAAACEGAGEGQLSSTVTIVIITTVWAAKAVDG